MILRRLGENLRSQNWMAIGIEFALVVLGVFLGILAANWNVERLEKQETTELLRQLDSELTDWLRYLESVEAYYRSAGNYADRATAAWKGDPSIDDAEFVVAAYQASQITGIGNNSNVWSAIFGAENLRDIEDAVVRRSLAGIMLFDYALVDLRAVSSRYREEVRKTIPDELQSAIREKCGDRIVGRGILILPERCDLSIPPEDAGPAAAALRARPELVAELYWHRAGIANQLAQAAIIEANARTLTERIGE